MGKRSREKIARRSFAEDGEKKPGFQYQFGLEKTCLFVIRWGIYLVLFTPLFISTQFFFPFVAPKTIFFRIIIEIILVAYLFLVMACGRRYRPKITPLAVGLFIFLAIFILTSFNGINLHRSFWSTNERMTGILTMLHLLAFFIILSSVFKKMKDWERFLGVSIIVGVLLSLYVLLGNQLSTRGGGTIGNTSFMAAYLLFDIFFAITLFLAKSGGWRIFSGICLAIMLPVLFTSTARGAIAAFSGGVFLLFLGYLLFSQKKALKNLALGIMLVLIVLVTVSAIFQPSVIKDDVIALSTQMQSRFVVWEGGWKGFLERPILGWGPENFLVVFNKHFNPCVFLSKCGGEIWFDRVHNIVLDTLVTTGILGFISYLAIFGIAIFGLLKLVSRIVERKNIFFPLGFATLLAVYFFQNLLVFDMINTYLVFFLSLGFIDFLTRKQAVEEGGTAMKSVNPILAFVIVIAAIFCLFGYNIKPLIANQYIIKTISSQKAEEAALFFRKSLDSSMENYESREYFAQKMIGSTSQPSEEKDREAFQAAFGLAESEMEKSVAENPRDFRPRLFLGELYLRSYRFSNNQEKLIKAEETLAKAIQLSPNNQQGYWNLAEVKLAQGKIGETVDLLKKAVDLEPQLRTSHWYLAMAYRIAGQNRLAQEETAKAEELGYGWRNNLEELKKVIAIYSALGEDQELLPLYLRATELEPDNAQFWAELAATYANLGQFDKAAEAAQRVIEIDPSLKSSVEKFLKVLPRQ